MKKRLFLAALCIFMLPVCFANSGDTSSQFSAYASGYMVTAGGEDGQAPPEKE